jgi:hypothetical protein
MREFNVLILVSRQNVLTSHKTTASDHMLRIEIQDENASRLPPILHEHALVIVIGSGRHFDHDIDKRSAL